MFKKFIPLVFVLASATSAFAGSPPPQTTTSIENDPSLFFGLSWTLSGQNVGGGTPGVTLKVLSTNERDAPAAVAGVTYNFDRTFGCDLGLGYNTSDATLTVGYDFCKSGMQFSLGATQNPDTIVTTIEPE
jgi:hypothetical protein